MVDGYLYVIFPGVRPTCIATTAVIENVHIIIIAVYAYIYVLITDSMVTGEMQRTITHTPCPVPSMNKTGGAKASTWATTAQAPTLFFRISPEVRVRL